LFIKNSKKEYLFKIQDAIQLIKSYFREFVFGSIRPHRSLLYKSIKATSAKG